MKTKDLIKELQDNDPSGEMEVTVGNSPIHFLAVEPAYWDGCYRTLIEDPEKKPYYAVTGIRFVAHGEKLVINTLDYDWVLLNDPKAKVEYDGDYARNHYEERVNETRQRMKDIHDSVREPYRRKGGAKRNSKLEKQK